MTEEKENKEEKIEVFPFIEGETIDLVAGNSKWAQLTCKWQNDPKVRRSQRCPRARPGSQPSSCPISTASGHLFEHLQGLLSAALPAD